MSSRTITLPEDLDGAGIERIRSELREASRDEDCRVILFTGGEERFCLGMNLEFLCAEARRRHFDAIGTYVDLIREIRSCPKVTLAVVRGEAIGGGLGIAATCDFVLAGRSARFGLPEALFGMFPGVVIPLLSLRCLPDHVKKLALTMKTIDAEEGLRLGLADQVADDGRFERELHVRIKDFSRSGPESVKAIKRLTNFLHQQTLDLLLDEGMGSLRAHLSKPEVLDSLGEFASGGLIR
ncbi:MAG TPA: enoyl-CoA hydratase/isomerase family protein [bacterium]|nr:enoyl-CoA hydratase/isomerase family protein [bacterium]